MNSSHSRNTRLTKATVHLLDFPMRPFRLEETRPQDLDGYLHPCVPIPVAEMLVRSWYIQELRRLAGNSLEPVDSKWSEDPHTTVVDLGEI